MAAMARGGHRMKIATKLSLTHSLMAALVLLLIVGTTTMISKIEEVIRDA